MRSLDESLTGVGKKFNVFSFVDRERTRILGEWIEDGLGLPFPSHSGENEL